MKIASLHAVMVLESKSGYLGPGHIKHGWVKRLWEAAQDTNEVYTLKITILGHVVFEKSCPFSILGFTISKPMVIVHIKGRQSKRIEDKWTQIAKERFGVPITLSWEKQT